MQNREEWLQATFNDLKYRASNHENTLSRQVWHSVLMVEDDVKLSCGFGYNCRGGKANAKVYTPDQSKGGKWEVFINPPSTTPRRPTGCLGRHALHPQGGRTGPESLLSMSPAVTTATPTRTNRWT